MERVFGERVFFKILSVSQVLPGTTQRRGALSHLDSTILPSVSLSHLDPIIYCRKEIPWSSQGMTESKCRNDS